MSLAGLGADRQEHRDARALAHAAREIEPAAVLLDDAIRHRQTEPGAAAGILGGEEWIEHAVALVLGNADARVLERHDHARNRSAVVLGIAKRIEPRRDADRAA